ncbi:MAG: TonB-dependent siderophore receptor [Nitrococcus sp.]|nr:TonB-dependent siderophore receptor [Nitrococcus sp.]
MQPRAIVAAVGLALTANMAQANELERNIERRASEPRGPAANKPAPTGDAVKLPALTVTASPQRRYPELIEPNRTGSYLGLTPFETPATVDVITREEIEKRGLRDLVEVFNSAPGVITSTNPGEFGAASMRGFAGASAYLLDGVRVVAAQQLLRNFDSYNFQRVEILKGPASVLHGNGALAGAINIVTRKPRLGANHFDALLSYGSFNSYRVGASFNQPIAKNAAVQASLSHAESDGYVDDTHSRKTGLTTGVLFEPTDRLSLSANFYYFKDNYSTAYWGTPLIPRSLARNPTSIVSAPGDLVVDEAIRDQNYNVTDGVTEAETSWFRTNAAYKLTDEWTLRNQFSIIDSDRLWDEAYFYTFNRGTGLIDRGTSVITYDHRFLSERFMTVYDGQIGEFRNRFAAGFEYTKTDFGSKRWFGTTTSVDPFNPDRGILLSDDPNNFGSRQLYKSKVDTRAVFLEEAFNLTPGWLLVGGLRYASIGLDRQIDDQVSGTTTRFGQDYESLSWRIGTVYDIFPTTALFAQYSNATRPVSSLLLSSLSSASFDLSTGYTIEVGVKSSFWDNRVTATASVYQIELNDILTRDPNNPRLTVQGGSQRTRGAELAITVALTDRWEISANGAILKAEFTELTDAAGHDLSGNRPPNVPNHTLNLFTSYRTPTIPLTIGGNLRYVGGFYTDTANTIEADAWTLLGAYVAYDLFGGTLTLRGRNLTDELYAYWSSYGDTQLFLGAPRNFTLTYRIDF